MPKTFSLEFEEGEEEKMTRFTRENTEDLEEIVMNLLIDLEQNDDCSTWECEECPLWLKEIEEDPRYGKHTCGWLLLRTATRKILRK